MRSITKSVLLPLLCVLFVVMMGACSGTPPRTSASASPAEVTFLELPKSASDIRFWDDGHNKVACFKISEADFRAAFPSATFSEIKEPKAYLSEGFGDPGTSPINRPGADMAKATSGLFYQKLEANGGGPTVIYDRDAGLGSYDFAPW